MSNDAIYMLNALWFKADGGQAKYQEYMRAALPFVTQIGGKLVSGPYVPDLAVIGEWDPDLILMVEYPSWDAFLQMTSDPEYLRIAQLREEALERSLLLRCRKPIAD